MSKLRALMLSPELPYPLQGGGALRTASLLNYLAQEHSVDLILFRHLDTQRPLESLPPGLIHRTLVLELPRHNRSKPARIIRNSARLLRQTPPLLDRFQGFAQPIAAFLANHQYKTAVIEHFWCAPYHSVLAPHTASTVLNLHNIESALHETEAQASNSPLERVAHRHFAQLYRNLESRWLPGFTEILTASEPDRARIRRLNPQITVFPNAIPCRPIPQVQQEEVVALSGNFDYHPNQIAVAWFAKHVWPQLAAAHPNLRWRLIGMNPDSIRPLIRALPRVECTGPVEDAVRELARAQVVIVPLFSGSGTRLKIVEAWAAARAVVSTPLGAEGLPAGNLLTATPEHFASALESVLKQPVLRDDLAQRGRACYEQSFTWEAAWRTLGVSSVTCRGH